MVDKAFKVVVNHPKDAHVCLSIKQITNERHVADIQYCDDIVLAYVLGIASDVISLPSQTTFEWSALLPDGTFKAHENT